MTDLRYAARILIRNPAFSVVAILSLGLGIGANTAIFSLIDTVILKPLPVREPQRLFFVDNSGGKSGGSNAPPYPCYETLRDRNQHFAGMAAFDVANTRATIDGVPEPIVAQYASGSYHDVLGVPPAHGRVLKAADDAVVGRGGPDGPVAVISHGFWKRRFNMSPDVLGKPVQIDTTWVTIVGVTPAGFLGLDPGIPVDVTLPMTVSGRNLSQRQAWWFSVVGRLKDGANVEEARADLDGMFQVYMREIGVQGETRAYFDRIALVPAGKGLNGLRRQFSRPLLIVMAIVGLVLLVGCANVATLLLARATARGTEIAVRLAMGAGRRRLIRQLLTEGALLVSAGAIAGLLFANVGVAVMAGFLAGARNQILIDPRIDFRVLAFTGAAALLTSLLSSLLPALQATRVDAGQPGDAGRATAARPAVRAGQVLVIVQVALSLILLCGAALFLRTLHNLATVDVGFTRHRVFVMPVEATVPRTAADPGQERARLGRIWDNLTDRTRSLPGIESVGAATLTPMSGNDRGVRLDVFGAPRHSESEQYIHLNQVTAGYMETVGIRLLAGRVFTRGDVASSPRVAILNQAAARTYFGNATAIGGRVYFVGSRITDSYEVVGVVGDARYESLRDPAERMVYLPVQQSLDRVSGLSLVIRSPADPDRLLAGIRDGIRQAVPGGFAPNVAALEKLVDESLLRERLVSTLASAFGGLALLLACVGLYGVLSYAVVRRTREIGIRVAVGARSWSVVWLMLRETCVLVASGLALGVPAVLGLTRYVRSDLFEVAPTDPIALTAAVALLVSVAALAACLPARRASRIDPIVALRQN